jgi:hypothetical protein
MGPDNTETIKGRELDLVVDRGGLSVIRKQTAFNVALGGLVVSVLATGPKVRGFDPDRGRWIFKGDRNP